MGGLDRSVTYYHILVINIKLGSAQLSAAPENALKTANCVKFLAAACSMRKKPHAKMFTPRYFPIGNFCMRKLVGTNTTYQIQFHDGSVSVNVN